MHKKYRELMGRSEQPARYAGGEWNAPEDKAARLRIAFCFPDTYEVGMSHLGMKLLTGIANSLPGVYCERVFSPWVDMEDMLRENQLPVYSIESKTPLGEFDIIAFTLQYEMSYSNILSLLDISGLPLRAKDRANGPLIIGGGPCAVNPEPLAPFFDAFLVGEGEEFFAEMAQAALEAENKAELLGKLADMEGVYVPANFDAGKPNRVRRRLADFENAAVPTSPIVPYMDIVHDRVMLEIMRGCSNGCRFCQAGIIYRPVRERKAERLMALARAQIASTGYEEISLSSLSTGDYRPLETLTRNLLDEFADKRVALSLPSLRVDSPVQNVLIETQRTRKSSLTFAPEAGTQRLRNVINKNIAEEDILGQAAHAFAHGWSAIKLYFMVGLPTETYADLDGIAELAEKIRAAYFKVPKEERARGLRITVSASCFVPKPWTPFQWDAQDDRETLTKKQYYLRDALKAVKGVNFNWHSPELSYLEAIFARGDRALADVLEAAHKRGCRFDSWSQHFNFDAWMEAFADCGVDPAEYIRARAEDEALPWDFIDMRVTKGFLLRERHNALAEKTTPPCDERCSACGAEGGEYCPCG